MGVDTRACFTAAHGSSLDSRIFPGCRDPGQSFCRAVYAKRDFREEAEMNFQDDQAAFRALSGIAVSPKQEEETLASLKRKQSNYLDRLVGRLDGLMRDIESLQPDDREFVERLRALRDEARKQATES